VNGVWLSTENKIWFLVILTAALKGQLSYFFFENVPGL
jgi:hypothetical protein